MIAIGRCSTVRVLRLPCPICEQIVEVTVEGLPRGADPQAWLEAQPLEEWDRIHRACVDVTRDPSSRPTLTERSTMGSMRACRAHIDTKAQPYTSYVIVRSDLPVGLMVANTIHAVAESTPTRLPPESIAVALQAQNEAQLRSLSGRLAACSIAHHLVVETDGPYAGQAMAIGVEPTRDRSTVRKAVSGLPLVR